MPIRIRWGQKQTKSLLAKMEGELEIERRPAERGKERVRVVDVGPWLEHDPKSDTFVGEVTIDIGVLCSYTEMGREPARSTLEFLRGHTKEVAEKIVETECQDIDRGWYKRARREQMIEVSNIEVACPNLKFTATLREKARYPPIEEDELAEDLWVFSRLVQNLNEGWSDEEVAAVIDELERKSR